MKQRRLEKERQAEEERLAKELEAAGGDLDRTSLPLENMEDPAEILAEMLAGPPDLSRDVSSMDEEGLLRGSLMEEDDPDRSLGASLGASGQRRERARSSRPPLPTVPRRLDQQSAEQTSPRRPPPLPNRYNQPSTDEASAYQPPAQVLNESQEIVVYQPTPATEEAPTSPGLGPGGGDFEQAEAEFLTPLERRALREKQRAEQQQLEQQQMKAIVPSTSQTQQPPLPGTLAVPESPANRGRSTSSSATDRLQQRMNKAKAEKEYIKEEEKRQKVEKGEGWKERIEEREKQTEAERMQEKELKKIAAERSNKRNAAMQRMLERREQRAADINALEDD